MLTEEQKKLISHVIFPKGTTETQIEGFVSRLMQLSPEDQALYLEGEEIELSADQSLESMQRLVQAIRDDKAADESDEEVAPMPEGKADFPLGLP